MGVRECHLCFVDPVILHHVPDGGAFALLCTACVLRRHAGSFCPVCFDLHEEGTPINRAAASNQSRVTCCRCPAVAHRTCLSSSFTLPYLCPHCSNPSVSFESTASDGQPIPFTKELARQVVCAAKIASASAHKAAARARADAEQNVREALLARRGAEEAIERVAYLMSNEEMQEYSDVDDE
ncbi:hypothetical protein CASFOL_035632 [Castilleja foliolosa]|uniref:Uncharacterized protein n=1 Tax=Castilleja foliolosa TaxID=1961234 RepID=A0ABD3BTF1_9LAMI